MTRGTARATRFASPVTTRGPNPDENLYPSCGSIVARQLGHQRRRTCRPTADDPAADCPGGGAGYLGVAYKPFETNADPANTGPFSVPNFALPTGVTVEQVGDRRHLLRSFDTIRRDLDNTGQLSALDRYNRQAWDILTSNAARDAFDIDSEPTRVRGTLRLHARVRPRRRQPLRRPGLEPAHPTGTASRRSRRSPGHRR